MGAQVVAQKRDYQASEVIAALLYIATNVAVVAWLTAGERLFRSFLLQPPTPPITVRILPDDVRPRVQHRVYPQLCCSLLAGPPGNWWVLVMSGELTIRGQLLGRLLMSCGQADLRQASGGTPPAAGATLSISEGGLAGIAVCVMERV